MATVDFLAFAAMLGLAVPLDALVRPRGWRDAAGLWLLGWMMAALFGLYLALSGNVPMAAAVALASQALLVLVSNAKAAMLGEPLLFSDLALIGAIFRHPQFYFSAIRPWQRVVAGAIALALLAGVVHLFVPLALPHLAGVVVLALSLAVLGASGRGLAERPDSHADVGRYGLLPVLLLYWRHWRVSPDPAPCTAEPCEAAVDAPELVVVVQSESFADPADLFTPDKAAFRGLSAADLALPGLAAARAGAWQRGRLEVSGFGAYTMRTEYGVLFGRGEDELGFRRYDPFLTALGEVTYALPNRLAAAGWQSRFIHPHDMRFYARDRIMPAAGFDELVAIDRFAPPAPGEGRYVTDAAVADVIVDLARAATGPTLLYAVTMENHGPWAPRGGLDPVRNYLRLAGNSDAMLANLVERIGALQRPAMLVFFGDHRPSIPGATRPDGARHTPYVIVRFDADGQVLADAGREASLTPAKLHHAILDLALGRG